MPDFTARVEVAARILIISRAEVQAILGVTGSPGLSGGISAHHRAGEGESSPSGQRGERLSETSNCSNGSNGNAAAELSSLARRRPNAISLPGTCCAQSEQSTSGSLYTRSAGLGGAMGATGAMGAMAQPGRPPAALSPHSAYAPAGPSPAKQRNEGAGSPRQLSSLRQGSGSLDSLEGPVVMDALDGAVVMDALPPQQHAQQLSPRPDALGGPDDLWGNAARMPRSNSDPNLGV